jgi:two-component system response regulator HydG
MEKKEAQWLKSPVSERAERLQPERELVVRPYFGAKRRLRLYRTQYLLGTGAGCDVKINDPFVSEHHAELKLCASGGGYWIEDLGSRNGIFLNGVRILKAPLPAQGVLRIGRTTLSWHEALEEGDHEGLVVADPFMLETVKRLQQVARSPLPVLLLGETGTGKEILARLLHSWSIRASGPYVAMNGALAGGSLAESELFGHKKGAYTGSESPRMGALKSANGGTFFLDEVADVPASAQVKLLRALESGEIKSLGSDQAERSDFRLVSATSQDVSEKIQQGSFRLDLYYRIAGFVVHVPPLRERPLDILAIARKLLTEKGFDLDKESEGRLLSYSWPGNVRELKSALERAMVLAHADNSARVLPEHLGSMADSIGSRAVTGNTKKARTLEAVESECIRSSLERNGWSRSVAAKELGIARSTLFEKMKKFGIRDAASLSN